MGYISDSTRNIILSNSTDEANLKNLQIHQKGVQQQQEYTQNSIDRRRERREKNNHLETVAELLETKQKVLNLEKKLKNEEHKNEVIRDLAVDIIITRSSMHRTLNYLADKWKTQIQKTQNSSSSIDDEITNKLKEERDKIEKDPKLVEMACHIIDSVAEDWVSQKEKHIRRPKNK